MKPWSRIGFWTPLWLASLLLSRHPACADGGPYPAIEELLPKVIERAKQSRRSPAGYDFTRAKTTTHYDSDNEVVSREEKIYRITEKNGKPKAELISKDGEAPPPRPAKREPSEPRTRARSSTGERHTGNDSLLHQINDDMVKRFRYAITARELVQGRPTLVIDVQPRKDVKISSTEEEVLSRIAGRVWIDEEESEVVQAHVSLQETLKIGWGGMLGALRELRFSVTRSRLAAGVWVNSDTDLWLHFRQLFSAKRIEVSERVSNVTPALIPPATNPPPTTAQNN